MLRYARLDIFALRQIRYNLPCGRFRYDINPSFAEQTYRAQHIENPVRDLYRCVVSLRTQGPRWLRHDLRLSRMNCLRRLYYIYVYKNKRKNFFQKNGKNFKKPIDKMKNMLIMIIVIIINKKGEQVNQSLRQAI